MTTEATQTATQTNQEDPGSALLNTLKLEKLNLSKTIDTLNTQLKKFEGVDPDEYFLMKTKPTKSKDMDENQIKQQIESQLKTEWGTKLSTAEQRAAELESQLKEMKVTDKVIGAFGDSVVPETSWVLKELIRKHCDIVDNQIVVKDESGKILEDAPGKKVSIEQWKSGLMAKMPNLFKANLKTGTGTDKQTGATISNVADITAEKAKGMTKDDFKKLSPSDQAKIAKLFLS